MNTKLKSAYFAVGFLMLLSYAQVSYTLALPFTMQDAHTWIQKNPTTAAFGGSILGACLLSYLQQQCSESAGTEVTASGRAIFKDIEYYRQQLTEMHTALFETGDAGKVQVIFNKDFKTNIYLSSAQCQAFKQAVDNYVALKQQNYQPGFYPVKAIDKVRSSLNMIRLECDQELGNKQKSNTAGDNQCQSAAGRHVASSHSQNNESTLSHLASVLATPEGLGLLALALYGVGAYCNSDSKGEPDLCWLSKYFQTTAVKPEVVPVTEDDFKECDES